MKHEEAYQLVEAELHRAIEKHPAWPESVYTQLAIIGEEFGELQQAVLQQEYEDGRRAAIKEEAVQLAAMAVRFLANLEDGEISQLKAENERLLEIARILRKKAPSGFVLCDNCARSGGAPCPRCTSANGWPEFRKKGE